MRCPEGTFPRHSNRSEWECFVYVDWIVQCSEQPAVQSLANYLKRTLLNLYLKVMQ